MTKAQALEELAAEIAASTLPLMESNLVFGEGNPDAEVVFVGEAPGYHEDVQRRPFVGRGGQLLNQLLGEMGWQRENVYITNVVKRRPPDNRDPLPEEISAYQPYLTRQIEIINPRVVVPLGRFAMNYFLPEAKISRDQGRLFKKGERLIYPVYHPAAALRATAVLEEFRKSLQRLPKVISGELTEEAPIAPAPAPTPKPPAPPPQTSLF